MNAEFEIRRWKEQDGDGGVGEVRIAMVGSPKTSAHLVYGEAFGVAAYAASERQDNLAAEIDLHLGGTVVLLNWIEVARRLQGKGYGTALLRHTIEFCRDVLGAERIYLQPVPSVGVPKHRLVRFYEREGFRLLPFDDHSTNSMVLVL